MKTSIIIPTYNESSNIKNLVEKIHKNMKKDYELIIVDDNSPDLTWKVAQELSKKYPIKVIKRKGKLGLTSAIATGLKQGKGNILCVIDADLSHPPSLIPKLINEIYKGYDIAIGSRKIKDGGVENWPLFYKTVSHIAGLLARPLIKVKDPMSGFFTVKKNIIKKIEFKSKGYKILLELLVKSNPKFVEVPYIFENREHGKSKQSIKEYFYYLIDLIKLYGFKIKTYLN